VRAELVEKSIDAEDFNLDQLCPAGRNLSNAEIVDNLKIAFNKANAGCYAMVCVW
jgi:hypothetical protein